MTNYKKAGIITFHNALNYGAILQTYALQKTLEDLECSTCVLNYCNPYVETVLKKPRLLDYHNPLNYYRDNLVYRKNTIKNNKIKKFIANNLNLTKTLNKDNISIYAENLDVVFTGSDQVWNDDITHNDDTYFLDFVPKEKKFSYAASLGRNSISLENIERVYKLLSSFSGISIREKQGHDALYNQLGINSTQVLDPTLLLDKHSYEKFSKTDNNKYIVLYMLLYSKTLIEKTKKISKILGYPVYCINSSGKPIRDFIDCSDVGVEEWVTLFSNAEFIATNSFHGTAFSVNFNKQFFVELPPSRIKANSRIIDFLTLVGLENRIVDDNESILALSKIDYEPVNKKIEFERSLSIDFLKKCLQGNICQNNKEINKSIISIKQEMCCGCGVCLEACKFDAIVMKTDEKGFYRPCLIPEKCVNCGLCKNTCSFNDDKDDNSNISVYAGSSKNKDALYSSSSGAMFYALSDFFLNNNGVVYGAAFDENFVLRHKRITDIKNIKPLMGSKYTQSNVYDIYNKLEEDLHNNLLVLFVGTPCQVASLKKVYGKFDNLFLVDFVCHGVPSPKLIQEHIKFIEKNTGKKVINYIPRSKILGWGHNEMFVFSDGTSLFKDPISQAFKKIFYLDYSIRRSCFNCPYTSFDRCSDLTLADFWGVEINHPELYSKDGVSLILSSTDKGDALLKKLNGINIEEVCIDDIPYKKQPHLFRPLVFNKKQYNEFWDLYNKYGWEYVCRKYADCSYKDILKWNIKQSKLYKIIRGKK